MAVSILNGVSVRRGSLAHDPLKVDLFSDWKAVFSHFSISMAFVKTNGSFVFAEDTDIDFGGFAGAELFLGPGHEFFAKALPDEFLADIELPELHRARGRIFGRDMDGTDFGVADDLFFLGEDLKMKVGIVEFRRDGFFRVNARQKD